MTRCLCLSSFVGIIVFEKMSNNNVWYALNSPPYHPAIFSTKEVEPTSSIEESPAMIAPAPGRVRVWGCWRRNIQRQYNESGHAIENILSRCWSFFPTKPRQSKKRREYYRNKGVDGFLAPSSSKIRMVQESRHKRHRRYKASYIYYS